MTADVADASGAAAATGEPGRAAAEADTTPWVFCGPRRLPLPGADWFEPPARLPAIDDTAWQVACALADPVAAPPLVQLAGGARRVVITVPDPSRPCPVAETLPQLLAELAKAGLDATAVTVVVGCGLHRATTAAEKAALVGPAGAGLTVVDAQGLEQVSVDLGRTADGTPVLVNEHVATADVVITVGVVEPHLYAGYSGGVKGVAIGCAGAATIAHTHRPAFIDRAGVTLGKLDGNPFQETLREIAARTRLRYAVNAVVNELGRPAQVAAGDPVAVQRSLAAACAAAWLRPVGGRFDVLVAGVHAPKSDSLYQASRAATYVGLAARPALADGGLLILCADLPNGVGDGPGERNFAALLAAEPPAAVIARGRREPLGPGGQRAYVVAKVLGRFRLAVHGCAAPGSIAGLGIADCPDVGAALAAEAARLGRPPRVLAVADAMATVVHEA